MKKIRVEDAVGQILCHDMTGVTDGVKGVVFKRGHTIEEKDVAKLLDIGKSHIFAWEPGADEVHEEDAALIAAKAVCGDNIYYDTKPSEGKVLMYAEKPGLFRVNLDALREINSVGDYTIASVPNYYHVSEKGMKLGGIRIVPLVTKKSRVDSVCVIAQNNKPVFSVLPFKHLKCGVIITGSEVYYGRIQDKFEPIMREKLENPGGEILGVIKCPDELTDILSAVRNLKSQGAELILLTGGMSVDPDDLTPSAIRECGAEVLSHGVPMQPGNMLMPAYLDGTLLIGVPGASMHSKVTSLDVFLPRVFAGLTISRDDLSILGAGGFCLGCDTCTYPRCYFGRA